MLVALLASLLLVVGCADNTNTPGSDETSSVALPESLFLAKAPEGAQPITALKASAKEGDEVVVRVIVGGTNDPIVQGRASAAIIDAALANACVGEDDHCKTPWDYCCTAQEDITANLATLQVIDDAGKVIATDFASRIKPLTTLIVRGVVGPRPDPQVLTINATGIHIEAAGQ